MFKFHLDNPESKMYKILIEKIGLQKNIWLPVRFIFTINISQIESFHEETIIVFCR